MDRQAQGKIFVLLVYFMCKAYSVFIECNYFLKHCMGYIFIRALSRRICMQIAALTMAPSGINSRFPFPVSSLYYVDVRHIIKQHPNSPLTHNSRSLCMALDTYMTVRMAR